MNYVTVYSRVCRYAADEGGAHSLLRSIPISSWQGRPGVDHQTRLVASDYLRDLGREDEADLLADTEKHVYYENGKVKAAADVMTGQSFSSLTASEKALLRSALRSSTSSGDTPFTLDRYYNIFDFDKDTAGKMIADWRHFKDQNAEHLHPLGTRNAASHFWLSRNGHGTGFFDRGDYYGEDKARHLHEEAKKYGEFNLYVPDDDDTTTPNLVYGS